MLEKILISIALGLIYLIIELFLLHCIRSELKNDKPGKTLMINLMFIALVIGVICIMGIITC